MDIIEFIKQKKSFYDALIKFLDNDEENLKFSEVLINNFDDLQKEKDSEEIKSFLRLIVQVVHYHHKNIFFYKKIERILSGLFSIIQEIITNSEIFDICKSNRRILLYLIQNNIVSLDKPALEYIINNIVYRHFFYPEIKSHITKEEDKKINKKLISEDFENKRQKGENDSFICELIRNDSVENFISFVSQNNIPLSTSKIKYSIFEINPLLNEKEADLIEYAAFFGSIQIFKYLLINGVHLTPSIWLYVIHSNNPELIQILIDNQIKAPDVFYEKCFYEAIKCHHNDVAQYIEENFLSKNYLSSEEIIDCILRYYNYSFFPDDILHQSLFFYLCNYDHVKIVNLIMKHKKDEFEAKMIFFLCILSNYKIFYFN